MSRAKKSTVNKAGNYTKPTMRKEIFSRIKSGSKGGGAGQWSARKAQMLAKAYKKAGSHKMANGTLHTNKSHTKTSVKLFHFKDLSKKAKIKAKK
jgi:hypothetical protein